MAISFTGFGGVGFWCRVGVGKIATPVICEGQGPIMTIPVIFVSLGMTAKGLDHRARDYERFLNADQRFTAQVCIGMPQGLEELVNLPEGKKWFVLLSEFPVRDLIFSRARAQPINANVLVVSDKAYETSKLTPVPVPRAMVEAGEPITVVAHGGIARDALRDILALRL